MLYRVGWQALIVTFTLLSGQLFAQQSTLGGSLNPVGDSFHENIGLSWGVQGNGWFLNSIGPAPAPFGGPGGGASFGGGFGGGGFGGGFRLTAEQGASTTMSSQSPSVTMMNGGTGYFSDTTIRPFVTGLIPVVGNMPTAPALPTIGGNPINPVLQRLDRLQAEGRLAPPRAAAGRSEKPAAAPLRVAARAAAGGPSSAERGDLSVAEIKARRASAASAEDAEIAAYVAKAEALAADGKPSVARVYYQMAARRATGMQQQQLLAKLRELTNE